MSAQRKVTEKQKEAFLELIDAHKIILFGKFQGDMGIKLRTKIWKEIVEKMDVLGEPKKDLEQWKRVSLPEPTAPVALRICLKCQYFPTH